MIKILIILLSVGILKSTVDIDMAEFKYLADHLEPIECRKLIAALHFESYDLPPALDTAVENVSEDVQCLRLLLHWNSSEGEGKGQTHDLLFRRLRQIGRDDLADWLGKTVFHELGDDLNRMLDNPFGDFLDENLTSEIVLTTEKQNEIFETNWKPSDTISWLVIITLVVVTIIVITKTIIISCAKYKHRKQRRRIRKNNNYRKLEYNTDTESEDRFDIRKKDDPALTLMGV